MTGGEEGRGEKTRRGRHLRPREKMMFSLREKILCHAPLSQPRVPRMKIQTPSQEMKGHPGVSVEHGEVLEAGETGQENAVSEGKR